MAKAALTSICTIIEELGVGAGLTAELLRQAKFNESAPVRYLI